MARTQLCVTIAVLVGPTSASLAQTSRAPMLEAREKQPYGKYVTNAEGRALYILEKDAKGISSCYAGCADVWPPLLTSGKAHAGPSINNSLVDTIKRKDGKVQVTYAGLPLYYYVKDQGAGSTTGQDVHDKWGEWYLLSPEGKKIETEKKK